MWALYECGDLHPESELTGLFEGDEAEADVDACVDGNSGRYEGGRSTSGQNSDCKRAGSMIKQGVDTRST